MPDPVLLGKASVGAALVAGVVLLLCGWPWRTSHPGRVSGGAAIGVALGLLAGAWLLGLTPQFPPREDQDRLLLVLIPAAVSAEVAAAVLRRPLWVAWLLRLIVAAGAARVLLHGSTYITDLTGSGTRAWSVGQTWLILAGLAAALLACWVLLDLFATRTGGRAVLLFLAFACGASGVTVMLSGYASGGQLGFPLGAALAGVLLASFVLSGPLDSRGPVGVGVIGLFGLQILGSFFGELTTLNAAMLFLAPLLCWLTELPFIGRVKPRFRWVMGLILICVPMAVVLTLAAQKFAADSAPSSTTPDTREPSIQDYMDFGK
jgi:hypothetical protein